VHWLQTAAEAEEDTATTITSEATTTPSDKVNRAAAKE
jgi:hypothetical protein